MPKQKKRGIESHITVRGSHWEQLHCGLAFARDAQLCRDALPKKKLVTKSLQIGSSALYWILWFWFNGILYPMNRSPCLLISFTNYSILCLFFWFLFIFCYEWFGASDFYVYANQESVCIWFRPFFLPWEEYLFETSIQRSNCVSHHLKP